VVNDLFRRRFEEPLGAVRSFLEDAGNPPDGFPWPVPRRLYYQYAMLSFFVPAEDDRRCRDLLTVIHLGQAGLGGAVVRCALTRQQVPVARLVQQLCEYLYYDPVEKGGFGLSRRRMAPADHEGIRQIHNLLELFTGEVDWQRGRREFAFSALEHFEIQGIHGKLKVGGGDADIERTRLGHPVASRVAGYVSLCHRRVEDAVRPR